MEILKLKDISFTADNTEILKEISLTIEKGDCISIIGPSGSGKSTMLKLCSDLLPPSCGTLLFKNEEYPSYKPTELRRLISYCVQTPILFGDTVLDNLIFPFNLRNKTFNKEKALDFLKAFNLSPEYLIKDIKTLSGGEKQRIALIRNLLFKPEILLLDEVTSALDKDNSDNIERIIGELNKDGVTVLWITHSQSQSTGIFNKRLTLENGQIIKMEVLK